MDPLIAEQIRQAWPTLSELGVEHVDVFGSVARGTARPDSDVDVLVHLSAPATFRQLLAIAETLTAAVGRRVDVTTPRALRDQPRLRRHVLEEAVRVA